MRRLWLGVTVVALMAGACSSDDGSDGARDSSESSATTNAQGLPAKLIAASDLPEGFERISVGERDPADPDPGANNTEFCSELTQHRRNFPGERIAEADFQRRRGSSTIFVNEQITRYATTADATRAFADFEKALGLCSSVSKTDAEGSTVGTFAPVEFVTVGDDTYATKFDATQTVDNDSATISGHFVALRATRYVVLFSALGSADTLTKRQCEQIAGRIVAKI